MPSRRRSAGARARPQSRRRLWPKVAAGVASAIVLAMGAAVLAIDHIVPVDTVRDRLIAEVKGRTGRDLTIGQRPSVSVWPRLAVSLQDVALSEPAAMGGAEFARASSVDAQAELWPLLAGQLKLERLLLKDPVISLRVDRNGRRSWDFAESLPPGPVRYAQATRGTLDVPPRARELDDFAKGATASAKSAGDALGLEALALRHVQVINGTVRHNDERAGVVETVTGLNAVVTAESLAAPLSINGEATWRGKVVTTATEARPLRAVLEQKPFAIRTKINGQGFDISYAGNVTSPAGPELDGKLVVKAASIQDLSAWIGQPLGGGLANGALDLAADLRTKAIGVTLGDLTVTTGGMTIRGGAAIAVAGLQRPKLVGALQFSVLDVDQIAAVRRLEGQARDQQPAAATSPPAAPGSIDDLLKQRPAVPAGATSSRPQVRGFTGRPGWSEEPMDFALLGALDADLKVSFGALSAGKMKTGRGQVALGLLNKVARLTIDDLQLYDGRAKGLLTADGTNAASAVVGANVTMDGVSALDLLRDAGGVDIVAGKARISVALAGQGRTERQIVETLTGKADIAMGNGALIGISIPKVLQALSQGRQPSFERVATDRSEFSELVGSANIVNGVAQNQDLRFTTPQVRVTGAGTVNLPTRTIDYVARPKLAGPQSIQVGQMTLNVGNVDVPVKIVGTFDKIAVAPDLSGVVKNPNQAIEAVKQLDRKEVESTVKGVLADDPTAKAKARDFLKNLLK